MDLRTPLGLLLWLDKTLPQSGLWALLLLSVSVGFIHGAVDAVLLPQRFVSGSQAALMFALYLLAVVVLGWLLGMTVSVALWMLLLMSAWHFGEPYGRWNGLPDIAPRLTRAVVGGAPVMLPVCGFTRIHALRYAWVELLASVFLYVLFSPLMAFALYLGVYHAPVHIWQVWRSLHGSVKASLSSRTAMAAVGLTTIVTWMLGGVLWWFLSTTPNLATDWASALRWLIVAFAALTAPHLVLISFCAGFLTKSNINADRT